MVPGSPGRTAPSRASALAGGTRLFDGEIFYSAKGAQIVLKLRERR
jgi:hypothetical protein